MEEYDDWKVNGDGRRMELVKYEEQIYVSYSKEDNSEV